MRIGTRSLLFGIHCVVIHPITVFLAYWRVYGFPRDPRMWLAFIVHDLGYWGKPNMDGDEGEAHVLRGAGMMGRAFGPRWFWWCALHSRYWSAQMNMQYSTLCVADKASVLFMPDWLYVLLGSASGEIGEYLSGPKFRSISTDGGTNPWTFIRQYKQWARKWVEGNRDAAWGPGQRALTGLGRSER